MIITAYIILLLPLLVVPKPHEQSPHELESISNSVILTRIKRGSSDILGHIKNTVSGAIGKASATSSGASSSSSSKSYAYEKPVVVVHKEFDAWALKKSILNTLFQAVKAITGGLTVVKGHLIKGSGYALSHGGKLIASGGDVVTGVGKKIALSAQLLPPSEKHGHYTKYFGTSSGHSSGPYDSHEEAFSSPTGPTADIFSPTHHDIHSGSPYLPLPYETNFHVAPTAHEHAHVYPSSYGTGPEVIATSATYKKLDSTPVTGHGHDQTDKLDSATALANQKAVEALQLLLQKLPNKLTVEEEVANPSENDIHVEKVPFKQYAIPRDALPATKVPTFRPLGPINSITSTYKFQLGPYQAVTETHLGQGNRGGSSDHSKYPYSRPVQPLKVGQPPAPVPANAVASNVLIANPAIASAAAANAANSLPSPQAYVANAPPLDLYHTMILKNNNGQRPIRTAPATFVYQPYEITKSIAYEI